jgi:fatty acid desaturase
MKQEKTYKVMSKTATPALYASGDLKNEFVVLKQRVKERGLLERQPVYYLLRISLLFSLLTVCIVFLAVLRNSWFELLNAIYLAFISTQIGLLSHEAGHRQMFHRMWQHDLVGLIGGDLLIGMSYAWWVDKHNTHHSHPNQIDMDPDIEIPFLEFTGREDLQNVGKFRQFLIKHQTLIFLPALTSVSIVLQIHSVQFLLRKTAKAKHRSLELFLMFAHFVFYFTAVFSFMHFWQAVAFIIIHQTLTGFYLGSIFAPNHKGMPVLDKESKIGFLHRQILTARNIFPHPVIDFIYGGLNYQIEHHLFPGMPRNKLKEGRAIVKNFCQENEIPYYETYALESLREIMHHLYIIGAPLRARKTAYIV